MSDETSTPLKAGPYELKRRLGAGGSGEVFEAVNPTLGKKVAIKVLRAEGPGAAEALLAEARAANAVHHRNLVHVFDFGQLESGRAYLVMELLEGAPLSQVLAAAPKPTLEALVGWLTDVAEALAALHAQRVAHGDLTPRNVFIVQAASGERYAKLLDFGLSRALGAAADAAPLAGTPRYLAPERLAGGPPSPQVDLFALGTIAFEALAGRPAFAADDAAGVAALHRGAGAGSVAAAAPSAPLALTRLVDALLGAEGQRPTADAVAQALRALAKALVASPAAPAAAAPAAAAPRSFWQRLWGAPAAPPEAPRPRAAPAAEPATERQRALALVTLADLAARPRAAEAPAPDALVAQVRTRALALLDTPGGLPAFPWVAVRVVEALAKGDPGANELVRLINQDAALTAQVVRVANSAGLAPAGGAKVLSARDAVVRLGFAEVARLASAAAAQQVYGASAGGSADELTAARLTAWQLGVTCAFAASALAADLGLDTQRAFVGGLLHDVGKDLALRALAALRSEGALDPAAPLPLAALVSATHVELGARMAEAWQLPQEVRDACAHHHQPSAASPAARRDLEALRLTSALAELAATDDWRLERLTEVQEAAQALGLDRFRLRATVTRVGELAARARALTQALHAG